MDWVKTADPDWVKTADPDWVKTADPDWVKTADPHLPSNSCFQLSPEFQSTDWYNCLFSK